MLTLNLKNKVALITGSSRGIGKTIAIEFAKAGADIILNSSKNIELINKISKEISDKYGVKVLPLVFDVADSKSVDVAYKAIYKEFKQLDILVNNAGVLESSLIGMASNDIVNNNIDINLKGSIYNIRSASRLMLRQKSGSIINLTSIMGVQGSEGQAVYSSAKAGIIGLTKSTSKELASSNIRVNAISPGFIDTEMSKDISKEMYAQRVESIKMSRVGKAEEVAQLATFLASDISSYITGQIIGIDGGMVL
jgi:3-oxoacyl-[acyl-carrier protein] reductase